MLSWLKSWQALENREYCELRWFDFRHCYYHILNKYIERVVVERNLFCILKALRVLNSKAGILKVVVLALTILTEWTSTYGYANNPCLKGWWAYTQTLRLNQKGLNLRRFGHQSIYNEHCDSVRHNGLYKDTLISMTLWYHLLPLLNWELLSSHTHPKWDEMMRSS
jgi:hypothetical protein